MAPGVRTAVPASDFQSCLPVLSPAEVCLRLKPEGSWHLPHSPDRYHQHASSPKQAPAPTAQTGALRVVDQDPLRRHTGSWVRLSAQGPVLEPGPALAGSHKSWCHLVPIWLNQEIGLGPGPPDRQRLPSQDHEVLSGPKMAPPACFGILGFATAIGACGSLSWCGCGERDCTGACPNISPPLAELTSCLSGCSPAPRTRLGGSRHTRPSRPGPDLGPT